MKHNLLVTCIDETDTGNPGQWISDLAEYDLIYLCYSNDIEFYKYLQSFGKPVLRVHSGKWKNIKWFIDNFRIKQYEFYWFPDPDLIINIKDINKFFKIVNKNNFGLCQPSLTKNSICSHSFLRQKIGKDYRKVDFVEVMCPCFSRKILGELLWTFDLSFSGYGLDILWAKYMICYVINSVSVCHPRDQNFVRRAIQKGFPKPEDELQEITRKYNLNSERFLQCIH